MNTLQINRLLSGVACTLALTLAAGCSHLPAPLATSTDSTVVIGKFRLIRNGQDVELGRGFGANKAVLHVVDLDRDESFTAGVGQGGEFSWTLKPGRYQLAGMDFLVRGQRMNVDSQFHFEAATGGATYVGTINLETTFENGYYGLHGQLDDYSISDDCKADCGDILARLGLAETTANVSLARAGDQLLSQRMADTRPSPGSPD